MRKWLISFVALGLTACGAEVPESADDPDQEAFASANEAVTEIDPQLVQLGGEGLSAGSERFYFAAGQREVEAALGRALGKPTDGGEYTECGAGPMEYASYSGGLTVNFQDGQLVGWMLEGGAANITMGEGPTIGTLRGDVETLPGFAEDEASTLGEEFSIEGGPSGFFEEDAVAILFAGTQCFFR